MSSTSAPEITPETELEQRPLRLDVESGVETPSSNGRGSRGPSDVACAAPPLPSLSERFSTLLKRLRRQASSQHERVPSNDGDEQPMVTVVTEGGPGESLTSGGEQTAAPGSPCLGRTNSGGRKEKVCLICLDPLSDEDFRTGRAISLQCACRGDLAVRHKECAIKWVQVKGDNICELCKQPVRNLPAPPPRVPPSGEETSPTDDYYESALYELAPTRADLVFDCVRVTWVAMIISVLFFEMSLGAALWTGLVAGLAYSVMVKIMYRRHWAQIEALQLQQQQLREQQAALHEQQGQRQQPQAVPLPPATAV